MCGLCSNFPASTASKNIRQRGELTVYLGVRRPARLLRVALPRHDGVALSLREVGPNVGCVDSAESPALKERREVFRDPTLQLRQRTLTVGRVVVLEIRRGVLEGDTPPSSG
jgi:hypothetical protein